MFCNLWGPLSGRGFPQGPDLSMTSSQCTLILDVIYLLVNPLTTAPGISFQWQEFYSSEVYNNESMGTEAAHCKNCIFTPHQMELVSGIYNATIPNCNAHSKGAKAGALQT